MKRKIKLLSAVLLVSLMVVVGCGGGGGGANHGGTTTSGGGNGGGGGGNSTVITGQVADGFVAGATVTAYQVNANGTQGAQIGTPAQTDQSGNYTLNLGTFFGPVLITSKGGTYTDTVTGKTIDLTNSPLILSAIVPNASGNVTAQINPLTTMAANVALTLAAQGTPVATATDAANTTIQDYFGLLMPILSTDLLNLTTIGCNPGANQASADTSAILAGISQLAYNNGVSSLDLVQALIQDVTSDGKFDGLASGATISVPLTSGTGTISLSTMEGTGLTGLANAITTFMTSTSNVCGASVNPGVISALSNTNIFSAPAAPTGVTAAAGAGSVIISWNTVTRATSYNLYLATSTGVTATSTQLPGYRSIPNVTSPYDISTGLTSTTYYFVVTAVSGTSPFVGSESAASAEVSATVIASALPSLPAQWARTVTAGSGDSVFSSISVTSDGSVYAAGHITGTGIYNFGNNVTAAGTSNSNNPVLVKYNSSGVAQWAQTVTGSNQSSFNSVSVAPDGSVYTAGYITGAGNYSFGNNITVAGTSGGFNLVLVKYDSSGLAQWAQTVAGSSDSYLYSISVAPDGSVYAAGFIAGTGTYNFGNSVTAAGTSSVGYNVVLVKYNSSGVAQWARTVTAGSGYSWFNSVSVAPDGSSVYAAGHITGTGTYNFGNSVTAAGTYSNHNLVLVKYDSSGAAQWAQTVTGSGDSEFYSVSMAPDSLSVYAAGYIAGTGTYSFGNSVTAAGINSSSNLVLVKYNSSGMAQWAQTVTGGSGYSWFNSVSAASDGSVYAAGYITGAGIYNFGNSVIAAGPNDNPVLVKYDSSGAAQWAQTATAMSSVSSFESVSAASDGSVYAAGYIAGAGTYDFGNSVTTAGTYSGYNIVLVKYNGSGVITLNW